MRATKIRMKPGYPNGGLTEIDMIYLEGQSISGFYKKADVHDFLKSNPGSIQVGIYPYPEVVPAISQYGENTSVLRLMATATITSSVFLGCKEG